MKTYLFLYRTQYNHYYPITTNSQSELCDLNNYYLRDYQYYDESLFTQDQSHYNETIIVNDLKNKILYIITKDFDIENHIPDDERHKMTNQFNSCKINYKNFIEFRSQWIKIKQDLPPFALIYRDDHDWVHCKAFNTQEEMEFFVQHHQSESIH